MTVLIENSARRGLDEARDQTRKRLAPLSSTMIAICIFASAGSARRIVRALPPSDREVGGEIVDGVASPSRTLT